MIYQPATNLCRISIQVHFQPLNAGCGILDRLAGYEVYCRVLRPSATQRELWLTRIDLEWVTVKVTVGINTRSTY